MHRLTLPLCAGLLVVGFVAAAAEPPGTLSPDDPLFKALEQVRREVDDLKRAAGGGIPRRAAPSPAMDGGMSAPGMMSGPGLSPPSRSSRAGVNRAATGSVAALDAHGIVPPTPPKIVLPARLPLVAGRNLTTDIWSFQPVKKPSIPAVKAAEWPRDDVDRFLLAKLEAAGIEPNPEADSASLCRRIHYDLTGLPPTEDELRRFVAAASRGGSARDAAYESLVDKLLASPRFGERWGRHWLDVVRYADSVGRSWNAPFTYAWRYRDYVIDSFNADTPLDKFITEQLAGDLLSSADAAARRKQLTATGFLSLGTAELRPESEEHFRMDRVDDQIDVTTRAFLGLTISCARCHDHKYDPVTMRDYYALAGIFYSTYTLSGQGWQGDMGRGGYVDVDYLVRLPVAKNSAGATAASDVDLAGTGGLPIHTMSDYQDVWSRGERNIRYATDPNVAMGVVEGETRDCPIRDKGEPYERGEAPPRGDVRIPALPRMPAIAPGVSGRLQLARWIAGRENPLTARVFANRVWRHLFGRGLVRTVDDFGATGERPTHPELLDHLALRLMDDAWSPKKLIRSLVLTRAYRTSSAGGTPSAKLDPANELFGRASLRRLEWEPLRDSLLAAAGRLSLERPQIVPVSGIGGKAGQSAAKSIFGLESSYRTVYLPVVRGNVPEVYGTFDFPDPAQIKGDREVTTVAPQALFLLNDELVVDCASAAAARLFEDASLNDAGRVRLAYRRLLSREAKPDEIAAALEFMSSLQPVGANDVRYRWTAFVQALLTSAEFRYVP